MCYSQKRKMPSTSIFVVGKRCLIMASCCGLLVVSPPLPAQSVRIEDTVKNLGKIGFPNFEEIHTLSESPAPSVEALIKELHVIPDRRLLGGQNPFLVEHVLWCIRALRFITGGKDFCAPTSHVFGTSELEQNRKYWLQFSYGSCLAFFSMWPSRGSTYIALRMRNEKSSSNGKSGFARTAGNSPTLPSKIRGQKNGSGELRRSRTAHR